MRLTQPGALLALTLSATCVPAAVIGESAPAQSITADRIAVLPRAQQAAWRDYLVRSARQMQADRAFLQTELTSAGPTSELIPPSDRAARSMPLNRPAEWYGSVEARRIADIIVSFQTPAGGWSKNLNLADHARRPGEGFAPNNLSTHLEPGDLDAPHDLRWNYVGTLDNDATTTELRFLARVAALLEKDGEAYRVSFLRGLEYLRDAGVKPDERVAEAIGVVEGNRDRDGRWPLQNVHEGDAHFEMEAGEGQPSRWNTLRALRVLDWFAQGG